MRSILEFTSVIFVGVIPSLFGSSIAAARPDSLKSGGPVEALTKYWLTSVSVIAVVLLVAVGQPNSIASLGILTTTNALSVDNGYAIFIGII